MVSLKSVVVAAVAAACSLAVSPAARATQYSQVAQVSGSGFSDFGVGLDGSTRVAMDAFEGNDLTRTGFAIARSSDGFISGQVEAAISSTEDTAVPSGFASARASGFLLLSDVVVTRQPGFESLPNTAQLIAQVSFGDDTAFNDLTGISGGISGGSSFSASALSSENPTMTSTADVLVDQPITLTLAAGISIRVEGEFNSRKANFTVALGGSPVFLLPEGYVANSVDGSVVDNFYVGPINPVPEPGTLAALLPLGLLVARRRLRASV
ncbi:MAG: hypothetical protein AAF078_05550 [Planctomycetota bacterium]